MQLIHESCKTMKEAWITVDHSVSVYPSPCQCPEAAQKLATWDLMVLDL